MADDLAAISADQEPRLGHYELLKTIGQGSFGKVMLGLHIETHTEVAVKVISPRGFNLRGPLLQEVASMARLHHPNIVELYEVIDTEDSVFLIMEYVKGEDLMHYLHTHGPMTEHVARGIFRQLVSAVHYCHQKGIVHRDLKPNNVLLGPRMNVKLADFGLSAPFKVKKLNTFCGSYYYAAPELFMGKAYTGPPVDIWSLGVMLYEMIRGTVPFLGENFRQLEERVLRVKYIVPVHFTPELKTLLSKLITLEPTDRSTLQAIMADPWVNMGQATELSPYNEPPSEDADLSVTQQMVAMGYQVGEIKNALLMQTYNKVMGTYLILKSRKFKVHVRIIKVKPFVPPDLTNPSAPPDQEAQPGGSGLQQGELQPQDQKGEQKAQGLAGPSTIPAPRTASPGSSPKSTKANPQPSTKWTKVIPRHSPKSKMSSPRPTPKLRTATASSCPKRAATPGHSPKWRTATPPPSPESQSLTIPPPPSPELELESGTIPPPPSPVSLKTAPSPPGPEMESRIATPSPDQEWRNTTSSPAPQSDNSSSSRSNGGTTEGTTRGLRSVARRCLDCVHKLCLRLSKKGRGKRNRVTPL